MATAKRKRRHARVNELTAAQEWSLLLGGLDGFGSVEEHDAAWWRHRDDLMGMGNPTTRPAAWWALEFKGERLFGKDDFETLERYGLLTAEEQRLAKKWGLKEHFERMRECRERVAKSQ